MREPLSKFQIIVNALVPVLYADAPIEASVKRYFLSSLVACLAIGLAYFIAVVFLRMPLIINLMATMMGVWIPLYHLMGKEFERHQREWSGRSPHYHNLPVAVGTIACVIALLSMGAYPPDGLSAPMLVLLLLTLSYLFSLWNVAFLSVHLSWELLEARNPIVTAVGLILFIVWFLHDKQ